MLIIVNYCYNRFVTKRFSQSYLGFRSGVNIIMNEKQSYIMENDNNIERTIRVFVSSTFRDMKAERDELIHRVFPELRKLCESRGVNWIEVDLRWGITDEQAAEGKVLSICLEEIDRCRPFFIGLLGERYGWVNTEYPKFLLEREPWLRGHIYRDTSITELEILHGVLNNVQNNSSAFFYFRDPSYSDRLPVLPENSTHADFVSYDRSEKRKIKKLKGQIRKAAKRGFCYLRENDFYDAKQLGQWVLEDFTALINQFYPEEEKQDDLTRIRMAHEAFALRRTSIYVGREIYFERINDYVSSNENDHFPLIVLGKSGQGKSTLLANWAFRYQQNHPEVLLIKHFIGAIPDSANHFDLLRRIMLEFKKHFSLIEDVSTEPEKVISQFPEWLSRVADQGKVVIILDAINQIEDNDNAMYLSWLPTNFPRNVRLIVSVLPGSCFEALKARNWIQETKSLTIQPLSDDEKREFAILFLRRSGRQLSSKILDRLVSADQNSIPLFMQAMLGELCAIGEHEKLNDQIDDYLTALDLKSLYCKIINRWINVYSEGKDIVIRTLRLIWASRKGLSEHELLGLLGDSGEPLPRAYLTPLLLAADSALVTRSGLISFGNDFLRMAVSDMLCHDPNIIRLTRKKIAEFFQQGQLHNYNRVLEERPWQLFQGEYMTELKDFLLSPLMIRMLRSHLALHEARRYWLSLKEPVDIGMELRAAFQRMINDKPEPALEGQIAYALSELLSDLGYADYSIWFINYTEKYYQLNTSESKYERCHISIQNSNALTLIQAGQVDQAKAIIEKILDRASERSMLNSDEVLAVSSSYAHLFHITGNYQRAYEIYHDVAERTARVHGKHHHNYIKRRANELCLALQVDDPHVEESDFLYIIQTARSKFGPNHKVTHASRHNLGSYYEIKCGDLHKAIALYSELLMSTEKLEGKESLETLNVMISCARVRYKMKEYTEANSLFSTCFERTNRCHGPLHPIILHCLMEWVPSALNLDDNTLERPFTIVLRAFDRYDKKSEVKHSQHKGFMNLFVYYMLSRGASHKEITIKYLRILSEKEI